MSEIWIDPVQDGAFEFRKALGNFATGVTVVATRTDEGEVRAFTANSFTSVSLDPALVLVCLAKSSASLGIFSAAEHFSINVLNSEQREISNAFASREAEVKIAASAKMPFSDAPYVGGALSSFICQRHELVEAGDHVILIGRVLRVAVKDGQPLGFFRGSYVGIGPETREMERMGTSIIVGGVLRHAGKVLLCRRPGETNWEIPSAMLNHGERYVSALQTCFARLGLPVQTFVPYSMFQEIGEDTTSLIFSAELAEGGVSAPEDGSELRWFDTGDAPWELVEGVMKKSLLSRYLREAASGYFGVYFDTPDGGNVMAVKGRPRDWTDWHDAESGDAGHPEELSSTDHQTR